MTTLTLRSPIPAASVHAPSRIPTPLSPNWAGRARELTARFAVRAADHDTMNCFVSENFQDLKAAGFFSAGIPRDLAGGGASYAELCQIIKTIAQSCGSTALALSMHFHLVAALVWRYQHLNAPVAELLKRIAREQLVLVTSGGSDWLQSSGTADLAEGGYRINARKSFASACPAGDLLLTSAVFNSPRDGATVLHFTLPLESPYVKILSTWRTLGMRGTGSNDILIENAFVPASAVSLSRPQGRWHPAMHLASKLACPLIYCTYAGLAEAAREIATRQALDKSSRPLTQQLAGEMENELFKTRLALERMIEIGESWEPGAETTNCVLMARTVVAQAAIQTVQKAMELIGGRSFYRSLVLERIYRDVQAARFHPLSEKDQQQFSGRVALGVDLDDP